MPDRFELLTPQWFNALHQTFAQWASANADALRDVLGDSEFTYQGTYTAIPPGNKSVTFHCTIRAGGVVEFDLTPVDRPDFNSVVPYNILRQTVMTVVEDDGTDAISAYDAAGTVDGKPAITSEVNCDPELWSRLSSVFFPAVHNAVPAFTLAPAQ
jgi:hypothetical protein